MTKEFTIIMPARLPEWRQGRKVPLNVYEGKRAVCQCHNVDDAKRLVTAMNIVRVLTLQQLAREKHLGHKAVKES